MVKSREAPLDFVFHALSDPTRRTILREVATGERTVGEVARPYAMSLAAVSKHLNVLESAGLILREKRGSRQVIHLQAHALREADQWLRFYENFWNESLDALKSQLEEEDNE